MAYSYTAKKNKQRVYICIDMKSFFASVECAERGLNPFETNLVVADASRGGNTICLAISPKMKSLGVKNRCRFFDIPKTMQYIIAKPRMKKYIEYTADIYEIYLRYISPEDIHVYSIDESFIDATDYLTIYNKTPKQFAQMLIDQIALEKHIPATAGIGTNLYLAKIALDIMAKETPDHMGYLDEELFKKHLWEHEPITDFWGISTGTERRLKKMYIRNMKGIALAPEKMLYKEFGINAELLIDHAYGRETCTMQDIKKYKTKSKSLSNSQILFSDYSYQDAKIVLDEMALILCQSLMKKGYIAGSVGVYIGYSKDIISRTGGTVKLPRATNLYSVIKEQVDNLYAKTTDKTAKIRKISICYGNLADKSAEGYDLFTDIEAEEKERRLEYATIEIKDKFGKNAIIRGIDLDSKATTIQRNRLIGGHNGE